MRSLVRSELKREEIEESVGYFSWVLYTVKAWHGFVLVVQR